MKGEGDAPETEQETEVRVEGVIKEALKVHKLRADDCLSMREVDGAARLVTKGGQKIVWRSGEPPVEIPRHQHPRLKPDSNWRMK
jgi:hypothetical protein